MGEVAGVLLIPDDGDPHGLLNEGVCGARPPLVRRRRCTECKAVRWGAARRPRAWWRTTRRRGCICGMSLLWSVQIAAPTALALAWDGDPVPAGLDRTHRAAGLAPWLGWTFQAAVEIALVAAAADGQGRWALGRVVLIDSDRREVTDAG